MASSEYVYKDEKIIASWVDFVERNKLKIIVETNQLEVFKKFLLQEVAFEHVEYDGSGKTYLFLVFSYEGKLAVIKKAEDYKAFFTRIPSDLSFFVGRDVRGRQNVIKLFDEFIFEIAEKIGLSLVI